MFGQFGQNELFGAVRKLLLRAFRTVRTELEHRTPTVRRSVDPLRVALTQEVYIEGDCIQELSL